MSYSSTFSSLGITAQLSMAFAIEDVGVVATVGHSFSKGFMKKRATASIGRLSSRSHISMLKYVFICLGVSTQCGLECRHTNTIMLCGKSITSKSGDIALLKIKLMRIDNLRE